MKNVEPIIKLSRVKEYYGTVIAATILGVFLSQSTSIYLNILLVIANLLSAAFAFMINDIEDSEDDKKDKYKKIRNPVSAGEIKKRRAQVVTYVGAFISLFIYLYLGKWIFLVGLSGVLLGFLYSHKRIRLKSKPIIDIVSHGYFLGVVYFATAILLGGKISSIYVVIWFGTSIFTLSALSDIHNEIRDLAVDRKARINNTARYINFLVFKKYFFFVILTIASSVFLYLLAKVSLVTGMLLVIISVIVGGHYLIKWFRNNKDIYTYPYTQRIFTLLGLILLLKP